MLYEVITWLSGAWTHPIYRKTGLSRKLLNEVSNDWDGRIVITSYSIHYTKLYEFIGNYKRRYPNIILKVEELTTENIVDHLNRDLLDVGILVTPLKEDRISEKPIFYEEMMLYAHKDHPLHDKPEVKVKDISVPEIWLLSDGHCFRHQVINLCSFKGAANDELPFHFEAGSLETLMNIIDKEGGITLIPELASIEMSTERSLHVRAFDDMTPLREVSLVYSRHFAKNKLIELLWKEIVNSMPQSLLNKDRGTIVDWK